MADVEAWHCRCGTKYPRHRKTCPACGAMRVIDPVNCCGSAIYWCPQVAEFECPTHGGFNTCCEHPERHTPLARFEVQAKAIMKWWRENREQPDQDDEAGLLPGPEVDPGQVLEVDAPAAGGAS